MEGLKGLLAALEARGMEENVKTFIDLTSANAIYFDYGEELTVVVPTSGNFDRVIARTTWGLLIRNRLSPCSTPEAAMISWAV